MKKIILTGLVLVLSLATVNLAAEGTWTQKADMPTARYCFAASEVNGKIYAIGGWDAWKDPTPLATVEMYDPATDTWERKADMPTPRGALATAVLDGKIYAIGGAYGESPTINLSTVEVYDPVTDTWEEGVSMSTGTCFHSAVVLEGRIYTIGGYSDTMRDGSYIMEEFDPNTNNWSGKASMPTVRMAFGTGVVNGRIYVIGGDTSRGVTSSVLEYDPITDSWTQKANMPTARAALGAAVLNERIYCLGGSINPNSSTFRKVEVYNPAIDTWETKADMPTPRGDFAIATANGKIYVFGGFSDRICSTVEEFVPPVIADFNGDGIVDCADICMMVDYWGTDEPLYDIAPHPSGDGIVDAQDLLLLSDHLFEESYPFELLAYWKLDETEGILTHNSVGDNDGLLFGDPIWQPAGGKVHGALQLDGLDDCIQTSFVLNPAGGALSAFAWVKGGAPGQAIISQANGTGTGETWLGIDASNAGLMTGLVPPPVGRSKPEPLRSQSVTTDAQWHHVGIVWDGTFRSLYVDGTEVARDTQAMTAPLQHADGGLYIGSSKGLKAGTFFSGLMDDVRIYNTAVGTDAIAALSQ